MSETKGKVVNPNRRNKWIGLFLLITPFVGLFLVLAAFAVASFVGASRSMGDTRYSAENFAAGSSTDLSTAVGSIINVVLGLLGIFFVVWLIIGVPLGILYLCKKVIVEGEEYDTRSGNGDASIVPPEVKRWSWGAFGLSIFWGLYHRVWFSLLGLIPLVGIGVMIYLGIKGNELAWRRNRWKSVEDFHRSQLKWGIAGVIVFVITTILPLLSEIAGWPKDVAQKDPQSQTSSILTSIDLFRDTQSHAKWVDYTSVDAGFKTSFPNVSPRSSVQQESDSDYLYTTHTYSSDTDDTTYFVFVDDSTNPAINEKNRGFQIIDFLETRLGSIASAPDAKLIHSEQTTFLGKTAILYRILIADEYLDGIIFMHESRLYIITIDYFSSVTPSPGLKEFADHFELL